MSGNLERCLPLFTELSPLRNREEEEKKMQLMRRKKGAFLWTVLLVCAVSLSAWAEWETRAQAFDRRQGPIQQTSQRPRAMCCIPRHG